MDGTVAAPASPERQAFLSQVRNARTCDEIRDLCRRRVLHGTPFVFASNEDGYYRFRKRIAEHFSISFHEVFITGSGKLGFSLFADKKFDFDSDIDVAIVAPSLYERIMEHIGRYQYSLRDSRRPITERELAMYHEFLEYTALGWIRPDKLPYSFEMGGRKSEWFEFFSSISSGRSEVGNYAVNAGVFRSYQHLENYQVRGLTRLRDSLKVEARK